MSPNSAMLRSRVRTSRTISALCGSTSVHTASISGETVPSVVDVLRSNAAKSNSATSNIFLTYYI